MGVEWVMYLQSQIFTRIKNEFSEKIKTKYSITAKNFSTVGSSNTPAVFPFIFVQMLPFPEQGRDLEGAEINAVLATFQIDVTDNKSQTRAKEVAFEILRIMKGMGFEVTSIPSFESTSDTHRSAARYRRSIGWNDIL